jgi:hypothetical protein
MALTAAFLAALASSAAALVMLSDDIAVLRT